MLDLLYQYGMNIDPLKIRQIYDIVDENKDNALNYQEFKKCINSTEVN